MNSGRERVERRLAAILAADVAGYSRLMEVDEEGTLAALRAIRRELGDPKIAEHRGRIVKTTGDGILVEFSSVVDAVRCAVEVQRAMSERNAPLPLAKRIEFRIGIHQGDIIAEDGDIFGDGVNLAARLEGLADPGGICISGRVHADVAGKINIGFSDLGEQQVKNISRPVRVFWAQLGAPKKTVETMPALALPDKPSLAVLPFQNMSGDPEQEYFADGIVEEITTAISRFPWLFVIARNSSFAYKGKAIDVRQVARELGVRYVLEGSVRKAGTRVRITGQLIDAATGAHLWADRFDGSLDDIFELQDQIASRVVGVIEPRLLLIETDRASRKPTENLDAYDLYLRALAQTYKRTEEGVAESIRLCRRALELDPAFAPAMGRIAGSRTMQLHLHWIPASGVEVEEGIQMARQALAATRDNPEVLRNAGFALAAFAGETETALTAINRAIELNPNYAFAYAQRGIVLAYLNRPDEAIVAAERAIHLSPNDPMSIFSSYLALSLAHLAAGHYEEALSWADRALGSVRNAGLSALRLKLSLCGYLSRREAASECLQRLRETDPEPTVAIVMRDVVKGMSPELAGHIAEGLRKAGLPEGESA
jgi:TolB-like protein/class 3 adenylate cyclase/Tfp pilus assembly protein PilF